MTGWAERPGWSGRPLDPLVGRDRVFPKRLSAAARLLLENISHTSATVSGDLGDPHGIGPIAAPHHTVFAHMAHQTVQPVAMRRQPVLNHGHLRGSEGPPRLLARGAAPDVRFPTVSSRYSCAGKLLHQPPRNAARFPESDRTLEDDRARCAAPALVVDPDGGFQQSEDALIGGFQHQSCWAINFSRPG